MNARVHDLAKERQLDWLLGEVLGGASPVRAATGTGARWLAAAIVLLAAGAVVGTALLRNGARVPPAQEPTRDVEWAECHGPAALAAVPADVTALRCFDFDDAACAQLARFDRLERLDLGGMDVNDKGYSVEPRITDDGVRHLAASSKLRWLCLARCHRMKGEGLQALEALPLEHLDLTYSGVQSPAIERLPRMAGLRTLVLSHCMEFHGRSLAAIASMRGLRRLELRACTTLSARDVLHLAKLRELRHLDLRDCQGSFRGQREFLPEAGAEEPPPRPVEDAIGITDEVVAALSALPLETLLLGGSESLTSAIGASLARMETLRALDLSALPHLSDAILAQLPPSLESLSLRDSSQLRVAELPALPRIRSLDLTGLSMSATDLRAVVAGRPLDELALGGHLTRGDVLVETLGTDAAAVVAELKSLRRLRLTYCSWLRSEGLEAFARLPELEELEITRCARLTDAEVAELGASRSVQRLALQWCPLVTAEALTALTAVPLRELDVYGTRCDPARVRELGAKHWPGCRITMPDARVWRAP
jgi:hypothetical protein